MSTTPEGLGDRLESWAEGELEREAIRDVEHREDQRQAQQRFDPLRARIKRTFLDVPPEPIEQVVRGLLRVTVGERISVGGAGKSTLTLYEMIRIILGTDLYGQEVMRPGPCVHLTAEDSRREDEYRLWRIMEDMSLSRPQREHVLDHLYIEDTTAATCRFVDLGENGTLVHTLALAEFIDAYRTIKPALVSVDPMIYFGPGERFVNDGEAELMRAGRRMAAELDSVVRFEHHTGKGQARDRTVDQYSGRGGSAGADNARFVHVLQVQETDDKLTPPARCTPEDIAKGNVLRLHVAKDSYGLRPTAPIWILRTGFLFTHVRPDPQLDVDPMEAHLRRLCDFLSAEDSAGVHHTANTLDARLGDLKMTRNAMRAALHVAIERKHLLEQPLPKDQQQGRRKTYLALGLRP